ncbi:MAG: hypothetical protein ABJJ82_15705 [Marinobacter sp.]
MRKVQEMDPGNLTTETSVSSVSALTSVFAEISSSVGQPEERQFAGVTPLLCRAADLMRELNLIPGPGNDEGFIDRILASKSSRERHQLLNGYREVWLEAVLHSDVPEHALDNVGRRQANRWLYEQSVAK